MRVDALAIYERQLFSRARGTSVKKHCNFCGEPMSADAKECAQCGWDVSRNAPPTTDPGDTRARLGVAAGIRGAYALMLALISRPPTPTSARPTRTPHHLYPAPAGPQTAYPPGTRPP